jgi:hypothetical protein
MRRKTVSGVAAIGSGVLGATCYSLNVGTRMMMVPRAELPFTCFAVCRRCERRRCSVLGTLKFDDETYVL